MNIKLTWTIFGAFLAFAGWMLVAPANNACASGIIASQTCDTQVWRTMEARARLETQREVMQNQNLIFKPDSILHYTCFDKLAGHAAANVGILFTHTSYWKKQIIRWGAQDPGLDHAINKVVIDSMKPYLKSNFPHAYMGGRGSEYGMADHPPEPVNTTSGSTYSCNEMAKVWATAKCANFLHTKNLALRDGFYPFVDLKATEGGTDVDGYQKINEVRKYPMEFAACGATPLMGSSWELMYRLSRNENSFGDPNKEYKFGEPLQAAFKEVRDRLDPAKCTSTPAIKTGVQVILSPGASTSPYDDGVCTNPGCVYNGSSCQTAGAKSNTVKPPNPTGGSGTVGNNGMLGGGV